MGQIRDARIQAWQEHAGLTPASGTRLELLNRMAQLAFELIQIIELEKSGIRDGDSQWSGGCPLSGVIDELRQLDRLDLEEWKATRGRDKVTHGSGAYP